MYVDEASVYWLSIFEYFSIKFDFNKPYLKAWYFGEFRLVTDFFSNLIFCPTKFDLIRLILN